MIHLGIRLVLPGPALLPDLVIYNSVAVLAAFNAFTAPGFNDHIANLCMGVACGLWAIGSTISTANSFFTFQIFSSLVDFCYSLFYPVLLFALIRTLTARHKIHVLEIFDTFIMALGITSISAGLLIKPAMVHFSGSPESVFLSIVYPIGDIAILAITLTLVSLTRKSARSILALSGILIFTATDLLFLYLSASSGYSFGSLTDDGWLLGLILIVESLYHHGGESDFSERFAAVALVLAIFVSSAALLVSALAPFYIPHFVLIPIFLTILLGFLRMQFAIRHAKATNEERELARTDELTGLPNRRRFLTELELLRRKEGTLLLLDLDGFKGVNDTYGHGAGDQLLKQISIRFSRVLPHNCLIARLGGDEFGVIVFGPSEAGLEVAQSLRSTLSYPFVLPQATVEVDASIGRVVNSESETTSQDLLRRADIAMYQAKRQGLGIQLWGAETKELAE
ncbi:MAG: diguanylate cyclase [Actinomycetes bacterium]